MNLYFTSEIRDFLDLFGSPMALKTFYSYTCNDGVQFLVEKRKISRRRLRFVDTAETWSLGSFRCIAEDGKEMYKDF